MYIRTFLVRITSTALQEIGEFPNGKSVIVPNQCDCKGRLEDVSAPGDHGGSVFQRCVQFVNIKKANCMYFCMFFLLSRCQRFGDGKGG